MCELRLIMSNESAIRCARVASPVDESVAEMADIRFSVTNIDGIADLCKYAG